jgi:hypothetical protein
MQLLLVTNYFELEPISLAHITFCTSLFHSCVGCRPLATMLRVHLLLFAQRGL